MIFAVGITLILMLVETFRMSKTLDPNPPTTTVHNSVDSNNCRSTTTAAKTGRSHRHQLPVPVPKWMRARARGTSYRRVHNVPMQAAATGVVLPKSTSVKLDARKLGGLEGTDGYGVPGGSGWNN